MNEAINTTEIERQVELSVRDAADLELTSDQDLESAGALLRGIKTILKRIDETFDDAISTAHAAHRKMLAAKKMHADPLLKAERTIKGGMVTYQREQQRLAEERERKLREKLRKEEEDRRLAEAEDLEAQGEPEAAEELISQPVVAPPVVLPKATKVEGVSTRRVWRWRLRNISGVPAQYLMLDEKKINGVVRSMGAQARISGIEVYPEDIVSARAG